MNGSIHDLLISIVANFFYDILKRQTWRPPHSVGRYFAETRLKLREMPFIFKDLGGDVLSEYVDVDFSSLDSRTLEERPKSALLPLHFDHKFKNSKRILFFGSAGSGKTTFQRHVILDLLDRSKTSPYFHYSERPIPIYVPLKVVDNAAPYPISRYILRSISLFQGEHGLQQLQKLSANPGLMLFLDGYDEIVLFADQPNFIAEEIEQIANSAAQHFKNSFGPSAAVRALALARLWIASRREFFHHHPFSIGPTASEAGAAPSIVRVLGIGQNRRELVEKIFDKYRARNLAARELLFEENFMRDIDLSDDVELREFSHNPLFLTVMCYIYAEQVLRNNAFNFTWAQSLEALVEECVDLLLHNLDSFKARDLPLAQRAALARRRSSLVPEKKAFLQHFALELYAEGTNVFTYETIRRKALEYFRQRTQSEGVASICNDLNSDSPHNPNIARQLVFNGLFVLVDRNESDGDLLDFPHRRFREVLAASAVRTAAGYLGYLERTKGVEVPEFELVLSKARAFRDAEVQVPVLERLLQKSSGEPAEDTVKCFRAFIRLHPPIDAIPERITSFVRDSLTSDEPKFVLPMSALSLLREPDTLAALAKERISVAARDGRPRLLALASELLERLHPGASTTELLKVIAEGNPHSSTLATALVRASVFAGPRIVDAVAAKPAFAHSIAEVGNALAATWPGDEEASAILARARESLTVVERMKVVIALDSRSTHAAAIGLAVFGLRLGIELVTHARHLLAEGHQLAIPETSQFALGVFSSPSFREALTAFLPTSERRKIVVFRSRPSREDSTKSTLEEGVEGSLPTSWANSTLESLGFASGGILDAALLGRSLRDSWNTFESEKMKLVPGNRESASVPEDRRFSQGAFGQALENLALQHSIEKAELQSLSEAVLELAGSAAEKAGLFFR